ncbi:MaoC/PaaZ C-terminal domain-containing protein [Aquabacter sp. CN5-332]|uniref:MaoC/PaaZ C-terminal domain-containing protein n=1 Tax=Aquabacter sp. CN5-332 TaxID=3156608 RepID=UPI0032B34447
MIDRARLLAHPAVVVPFAYSKRDVMLHGLGTCLGMDPMDERQLPFVYEDGAPGLLVPPTFACVLGWVDMVRDERSRDTSLGIDPNAVVVGQTVLRTFAPLPPEGYGTSRTYYSGAVDKGAGRGALICVRRDVEGEDGTVLATMDTWLYVRGAGGFGGPAEGGPAPVTLPERPADAVLEQPTPGNLALLYRLSLGDHNALHASPAHARKVGFERPILHGLATFSIALHGVLNARGAMDEACRHFRGGQATMTRPVFPGESLRVEAWNPTEPDAPIHFRVTAAERNVIVLDGGRADFSAQASGAAQAA